VQVTKAIERENAEKLFRAQGEQLALRAVKPRSDIS